MKLLGTVKFVQVQTASLKVGERPNQAYNPSALTRVDYLTCSTRGVVGYLHDRTRLDDVHHADHPQSKFRGDNGVSIGLTAHYEQMRARFGDHLSDGIAGENIIITSESGYKLADFREGLVFVGAESGIEARVEVVDVMVPCEPFSRYAAQKALHGADMQAALKFLHQGMRGFSIAPVGNENPVIWAGDTIFLL